MTVASPILLLIINIRIQMFTKIDNYGYVVVFEAPVGSRTCFYNTTANLDNM